MKYLLFILFIIVAKTENSANLLGNNQNESDKKDIKKTSLNIQEKSKRKNEFGYENLEVYEKTKKEPLSKLKKRKLKSIERKLNIEKNYMKMIKKVESSYEELKKKLNDETDFFYRTHKDGKISRKLVEEQEYKLRQDIVDKWMLEQQTKYKQWEAQTIQEISQEIQNRAEIWRRNDEQNRNENEKLYQLLLVQEIQKKRIFTKMVEFSNRTKEKIINLSSHIINSILLKMSLIKMNFVLIDEVHKRFKAYTDQKPSDKDEFIKMNQSMMNDVEENEKQAGDFDQ
jgi:hypothetical protein